VSQSLPGRNSSQPGDVRCTAERGSKFRGGRSARSGDLGLSSPVLKNISVFIRPKSSLCLRSSRALQEGRIAIVTDVGCGMRWTRQRRRARLRAGRVFGSVSVRRARGRTALLRTAKPCGPGTRCWCQVGGGDVISTGTDNTFNSPTTVTRRIRRRGERGISR
jgi:hypothetical protein